MAAESTPPRTALVILGGATGTIVLVAVVVLLSALYQRYEQAEPASEAPDGEPTEFALVRAEHLDHLSSYRWIDESNGVVGIPIERALELELRELQQEQASPAASPAEGSASPEP